MTPAPRGPTRTLAFTLSLALLAAVSTTTACSGIQPPGHSAAASTTGAAAATSASLPFRTPGHWSYHPPSASPPNATLRLADGRCLAVDHEGQRWLISPRAPGLPGAPDPSDDVDPADVGDDEEVTPAADSQTTCAGIGQAAPDQAPEALTAIVRRGRGVLWFVGASGTIYEASSPLGRITRRIHPPEPLRRSSGAGDSFLAVTDSGRLLRWNDGSGYERVDVGDSHVFDVAVSRNGRAVALGVPEVVLASEDGGRHFTAAKVPAIGALRVGWAPGGPFVIEGLDQGLTWDPRDAVAFTRSPARIASPTVAPEIETAHAASADMVAQWRGAIDGERYWEISAGPSSPWVLWRGTLDGPLRPLPLAPPDGRLLVYARGNHVVIAAMGFEDHQSTVALMVSHDSGATFGERLLDRSDEGGLDVAVANDGTLLVTGMCPPRDRHTDVDPAADPDSERFAGCAGEPLLLRDGAAPVASRIPLLDGPARAPTFSADGRSAYFLAQGGDEQVTLYVSHDGGATFEERVLELSADDGDTGFSAPYTATLTVSERGTLGVALEATGAHDGTVYLTADEDGRHLHLGLPPSPGAGLAGFGERVLAVSRAAMRGADEDEDDAMAVAESLDGGATWTEVPSPPGLLQRTFRRRANVVCGAGGCLLGDDLTRVGWGVLDEPRVLDENAAPENRKPPSGLRTAIVCEPQEGADWTRIAHAHTVTRVPNEHDAMIGRVAWSVPTLDRKSGAVALTLATLAEGSGNARITTRALLKGAPSGAPWASLISPQIEGIAVARAPLDRGVAEPAGAGSLGRPIRNLELAWENFEDGSSGHTTVADAGVFGRWAIERTGEGWLSLWLKVLSVSPKSLFVQGSAESPLRLLDPAGKSKVVRFPGWPDERDDLDGQATASTTDTASVDGTVVALTERGGGGLPRAMAFAGPPAAGAKPDEPWSFHAVTIGVPSQRDGSHELLQWTYLDGGLALGAMFVLGDRGVAWSYFRRLAADGTLGPVVHAPTPFDLPATPRPCSADEHKRLPRVRVTAEAYGTNLFPGTQHPVLIRDRAPATATTPRAPTRVPTVGKLELLTSGVVLRGTPASPCVDAFAAHQPDDPRIGAIVAGDLRQAWLFRFATPPRARAKSSKAAPRAKGDPDRDPDHDRDLDLDPDRDTEGDDTPPSDTLEVRPLTCRYDPAATFSSTLAAPSLDP